YLASAAELEELLHAAPVAQRRRRPERRVEVRVREPRPADAVRQPQGKISRPSTTNSSPGERCGSRAVRFLGSSARKTTWSSSSFAPRFTKGFRRITAASSSRERVPRSSATYLIEARSYPTAVEITIR